MDDTVGQHMYVWMCGPHFFVNPSTEVLRYSLQRDEVKTTRAQGKEGAVERYICDVGFNANASPLMHDGIPNLWMGTWWI